MASSLRGLSAAIGLSSCRWHPPGTVDPDQACCCDFYDGGSAWKKICFPRLGLGVKHIQANRNSQAVWKGFKFHYRSIASTGVLLGAESQRDIFLKVGGSPRWQCLCRGSIALPFIATCDNSLFFTNRIKSLCLISVTALTFWNANLWWTVYETAPNYREGISAYKYPFAFFWRLDIYIASLCQSPWQLNTRHLGYVFKYSYFQFSSN